MKSKKRYRREATRKSKRRRQNRPTVQLLKQLIYYKRTGIWIDDATRLHWHHTDPQTKFLKVSKLVTRSPKTIAQELSLCEVYLDHEHYDLHRRESNGN